jgi:hypothetical protein
MSDDLRHIIIDEEHLRLLSIGYMVSAGLSALTSLLGLVYVFLGLMMDRMIGEIAGDAMKSGGLPPMFFSWLFSAIGIVLFVVLVVVAILQFRTARCLKEERSHTFCMVIAGLTCLNFPYGTLLGVFTFMVLGRPTVKALFARTAGG